MKNLKQQCKFIVVFFLIICPGILYAQKRSIDIEELVSLALKNHPQLKVTREGIEAAKQEKALTRLQQLPSLSASASALYLGDVLVVDKDFSKTIPIPSPNFGNSYSLQASELIFKGGLIKKFIQVADLKTQLSELELTTNQQAIKYLVISNYLDLYKLGNQEKVYENNKKLAQERLENITKFYSQGMITRNEVIRNQLNIKSIEQAILVVENNRNILNYNLDLALGLSTETLLEPTEEVALPLNKKNVGYYIDLARENNPQLRSAFTHVELAEKNIALIKTDKLPGISAIAGYNMQKPITNRVPVLDMYSNTWSVGISLTYNIDNLYKSNKRVRLGEIQKIQSEDVLEVLKQNLSMGINAAYTKYQEAATNVSILKEAMNLAQENYRIIESKYLNQLAIQAEMTDAINEKIEAEIKYSDAEINVLYQYYNLLKTTGTL